MRFVQESSSILYGCISSDFESLLRRDSRKFNADVRLKPRLVVGRKQVCEREESGERERALVFSNELLSQRHEEKEKLN